MSNARAVVESLEDRRLLSAAPVADVPVPRKAAPPAMHASISRATRIARAAAAQATRLVGNWDGTVKGKVLFFSKKFKATLEITGQTDGTLTGSITVKGHTATGTLDGHVNADGSFSYTIKDGRASVKISGKLNAAGDVMSGKITAKYRGYKVKGSFKFERTA